MFQSIAKQQQRLSPDYEKRTSSRQAHCYKKVVPIGSLVVVLSCFFTVLLSSNFRQTSADHANHSAVDTQAGYYRRFRIIPEYERHMDRIVMSISDSDTMPKYQNEILARLPDYTQVDLMVPSSHLAAVKKWNSDKPYRKRVHLVTYDPQYRSGARLYLLLPDEEQLVAVDTKDYSLGSQQGTLWAQDLFEVATAKGNRTILFTACAHRCFQSENYRQDRRVISDNTYLSCLDKDNTEVRRLPLAFKGGNLLVDELNGQRIVFCGYDSVRSTRTAWRAFEGDDISDDKVSEMVEKTFDADEVVIVGGPRPQPEMMYHLDQAMLPLGNEAIAVARVVGAQPRLEPGASRVRQVEAFLKKLRLILIDLGYAVVDMDVTVENILKYQHYVNAIPYVDKKSGQKMILLPVFAETPDECDQQIICKNTKTLESLGYKVVCVPTRACELTGGIHCLVNVLQ